MNYDWVVVLNNQPVTELLISSLDEQMTLDVMEDMASQTANGSYLVGRLYAWQLGRETALYSNLRQGQQISIPSESILFITIMQRKQKTESHV